MADTNGGDDDQQPADRLTVRCGCCSTTVSVESVGHLTADDMDAGTYLLADLARCPSCQWVMLVGRDVEYFGEWEVGPARCLWPATRRTLTWDTPDSIRVAFDEAGRCIDAQAWTAATLMCRRAIELVAQELGASSGTLAQRLDQLAAAGEIDNRLRQWADGIRLAGNDAAHDAKPNLTSEDARDALLFVEALADYVFTYRKRYDEFTRRRSTAKSPPTPEVSF